VAFLMRDLLFLSHRIPYPPDKGEKIRAWHCFLRLARTHRMHLGCFLDDPADRVHLDALRSHCADLKLIEIDRTRQKLASLLRARPGQPLTLGYFASARLQEWTRAKIAGGIDRAFVYCSAMAPYLMGANGVRRVLDMVDVDSAKWGEYAAGTAWPARAVWAREARTLLAFERAAARDFDVSLFVSQAEADAFLRLAPEAAGRVGAMDNGVDFSYFSPDETFARPVAGAAPYAVFTGTMDYWPNVDAVTWFAEAVLPAIQARHPGFRFVIVGANPAPAVQRLAAETLVVTGRVPDVRPYLAHAALAVAPLRIARGTQNKVLEAMAMARPVVATPQAFDGLRALPGRDLLVGADAASLAALAAELLDGRHPALGAAARAAVQRNYDWDATLAGLDTLFAAAPRRDTSPSVAHEAMP
jgi:sugar transferase (PEP-CTERM/EpsH1 system associated)